MAGDSVSVAYRDLQTINDGEIVSEVVLRR